MAVNITTIYPPANRPGQQRNESYEHSLLVAQDAINSLAAAQGLINITTFDPVSPVEGQVWFRSDLLKLCIFVNGTVKRSGVFS